MCSWGDTVPVLVKIPADLSSTGREKWRDCKIDACIAALVVALQVAGIDMRGSCCGHGKCEGDIHLQDGRALLILDRESADAYYRNKGPEKVGVMAKKQGEWQVGKPVWTSTVNDGDLCEIDIRTPSGHLVARVYGATVQGAQRRLRAVLPAIKSKEQTISRKR